MTAALDRAAARALTLGVLAAVVESIGPLYEARTQAIRAARQQGATWEEIGDALGITKQAAHERYSGARKPRRNPLDDINEEFDFGPPLKDFDGPRPA